MTEILAKECVVNSNLNVLREQIDLPGTISEILGFSIPNSKGKVMTELFEK